MGESKQDKIKAYNKYLDARIKTSSREQLLQMLIDGAIRFTEQGKTKVLENDLEGMNTFFIRAQKIMLELIMSLDKDSLPQETYTNLVGLYEFVYQRLLRANTRRDAALADEALSVLGEIRGMWNAAIEKMYKEGASRQDLIPKNRGSSQGFVVDG